jgi:(1->4)-alpha-D-glucan 1-alpha-D-glucosylmutase
LNGRSTLSSTYRVQVRPDFDLAATAQLVGYLRELGVTALYSAPLLAATPGSSHGYDVVDPTRINPELGGPDGLAALVDVLHAAGLGLVLDIVPNHLGVGVPEANPAWWSVLRDGSASPYASWFDIDWSRHPDGRLVIPVLGDEPTALDELKLVGDGQQGFELRYYEHRYPVASGTHEGTPQQVHDRQNYRLVCWRLADTELNYRRFFAVSELAGLRVEDPAVFRDTHAEILRWAASGALAGIRVDHPDGLRDPAGYLARLADSAPGIWLVVEKILEAAGDDAAAEELPEWPVDGTTGYDSLREVCGVFLDPGAADAFPSTESWPAAAYRGKLDAATRLLATEVTRLTRLVAGGPEVAAALVELAARFPVYRSYLPAGGQPLERALAAADPEFRPVLDALAPRLRDPADELAQRFQQLTGAVMAKGVEDTAGYRWNRFIALNEVGGALDRFGVTPAEFHAAQEDRQRRWPRGMTTLSTHDTKRGEDVRARLAVLAELPDEWAGILARWAATPPVPDAEFARLLWQTVVGAWPIERERLRGYAVKAAREAATHTGWDHPDQQFEEAVRVAIDAVYDDPARRAEVTAFVDRLAPAGWSNSLGQKLIQLTMPGVPDTYQGTELWDNSLVDPDNRRPVDFAARRASLARLDAGWRPPVDATGAAKLLVVSRALRLRRDSPELFSAYRPVIAEGPAADHVIAYDRGGVIVVATRLPLGLNRFGGWSGTSIPVQERLLTDILSGKSFAGPRIPLADLLSTYPVALVVGS